MRVHAVFQIRDSKFLTLVLSPIFSQIQTTPCPLCLAWSTLYRPIFLTAQKQIFNFNIKSNAIITVRSHKTSTFACQLQKRNYSLSLKSLTYTSLRLLGVPYFFRQADYCLLFFWMTLVLYLIHVSLIWKTACTKVSRQQERVDWLEECSESYLVYVDVLMD